MDSFEIVMGNLVRYSHDTFPIYVQIISIALIF